jgi:ankyrin repeat protein
MKANMMDGTALALASSGYNEVVEVVQVILQQGFSLHVVNCHVELAFCCAFEKCYWETAQLLLKHGINIDAADSDECTPLNTARLHNRLDVALVAMDGHHFDIPASKGMERWSNFY